MFTVLDIVSVGLDLPRLLGEVNMEAFFYTLPGKQSYLFHGGSLILWLISICLWDFLLLVLLKIDHFKQCARRKYY